MAKRFTDSAKWQKQWFRELSPKFKCAWSYLCDNCDHAGFWPIDLGLMSFQIGEEITLEDLKNTFADHLEFIDKKIFVKEFIEFQYGNLNPKNRVHLSILNRVQKEAPNKVLTRSLQRPMDMDMDMELEMDKEKGECEGEKPKLKFDLESLYRKYPRKQGKSAGLKKLKAAIKSQDDYNQVSTAIDKFIAHHRQAKTEPEYIPFFSTFMSQWTDWTDPETGAVVNFSDVKKETDWDYIFGKSEKAG